MEEIGLETKARFEILGARTARDQEAAVRAGWFVVDEVVSSRERRCYGFRGKSS